MDTVLVLGSNSFSGASFCAYALKKGARVIGVSRSPEPNDALLPYKWVENQENFSFHQGDINKDFDKIKDLIMQHKPRYILNYAAQSMVAQSWDFPEHWFQTNVISTIAFNNWLRTCDFMERYVHFTTPEVYGSTDGFIKEGSPYNPSTPYAVSRAAADMNLKIMHDAYKFPVVFTRAANVYGPGQQLYRIIPRAVLFFKLGKKIQLHGGGLSKRSFIHGEDTSSATWTVMKSGKDGDTYHISTNEIVTIKDLVVKIAREMGVDYDACVDVTQERLGKDAAYLLDSSKIRSELGWKDEVTLDQGVRHTIDWVNQNLDALKNEAFDYVHKP